MNILKIGVDSKCQQHNEDISYIVAGCPVIALKEYTHKHSRIASYMDWLMFRELGLLGPVHSYHFQPEKFTEVENITVMYI